MNKFGELEKAIDFLDLLPRLRSGRIHRAKDIHKLDDIDRFLRKCLKNEELYENVYGDLDVDLRLCDDLSDKKIFGVLLNLAYTERDRFFCADLEVFQCGDLRQIKISIYRKLLERIAVKLVDEQRISKAFGSNADRECLLSKIRLDVLRDYKSMGLDEIPPIKLCDSWTGKMQILEGIPIDEVINKTSWTKYSMQMEMLEKIKKEVINRVKDPFYEYCKWLKRKFKFKVSLPLKNETSTLSEKPKTASLCYDRIWAPSEDLVPGSIRCWGGTPQEYMAIMSYVSKYKRFLEGKQKTENERNRFVNELNRDFKRDLYESITAFEKGGKWELECMYPVKSEKELEESFQIILRTAARAFSVAHDMPIVPIYESVEKRDREYREGDRHAIVWALSNLEIVDESELTWEQVMEFRKDKEARYKYKRFLHWLDKEMVGKSLAYVENEISYRLEDYQWCLKKHGIKTVLGTIEESLDGKYIIGASGLALAGHPILGLLGAGLLIGGKVAVKLIQTKLDFYDIERGHNSEISWVYEVKRIDKKSFNING